MAALALSLVMAGTGDKECFRTLRVVRKRLDANEMHYGHSMAINMAFGFLFLGSGAFTLSRSKFAIASLMCSIYPIFPREPNDNRYHLQALRHFWVMAIESRLI
jgi:anaphase-promoting complex subunit 1